MRDQSHGRINGSAAAAFATICERNRNTGSVLESAGKVRRRFDGAAVCAEICESVKGWVKLFSVKVRSELGFAAPALLKPSCEHNGGTGGKVSAQTIGYARNVGAVLGRIPGDQNIVGSFEAVRNLRQEQLRGEAADEARA
jgi:hypothetical protein